MENPRFGIGSWGMVMRRRFLKEPQTKVNLDFFRGLQPMSKSRASQAHAAGDRLLAHGRRILCRTGLNGASEWHVPDTAQVAQSHPDSTTERVVARTPAISLTPGHFVRMMIVALPSGMTTQPDGLGGYEEGGAAGKVKITVTYDNGADTEAISSSLFIEGSKLENGKQPDAPGGGWTAIRRARTDLLLPAVMKNAQNLAAWCDGVTATITVAYIGSPRVIDLVVHEEPYGLAYDSATGGWVAPMHAGPSGGDLGNLAGPFPVTQFKASDAGNGTRALCDAAKRLCQETGPVVWYWSAFNEAIQNVTDTEAAPVTKSNTIPTFHSITSTSVGGPTTSNPNRQLQSTAACVNASRIQDSGLAVLRGKEYVIPCRFYVYAKMSTVVGSPTATFRFECDGVGTQVQLTIASGTSYAWHSTRGYIKTGLGAQQFTGMLTRVAVSAASTVSFLYILVVYDPT